MIRFTSPGTLICLLSLLPMWWLAKANLRRATGWRQWPTRCSLGIHSLMVAALSCALAGMQFMVSTNDLTVIFLIDHSESVSPDQQARAEAYVRQALSELPPTGQAGIVVFGQHALIERLPAHDRSLDLLVAQPDQAATNIAEAIRLGLGLLPAGGQRQLVLLSDGEANAGDALQAARLAAARGVPLEVVGLNDHRGGLDVQMSGLRLPPAARLGQHLRMVVDTTATAATPAELTISDNGTPVLRQQVHVAAGAGQLEVQLPSADASFHRYEATLMANADVRPQNNSAEAFTLVSGKPAVLLAEGAPGEAANLSSALAAAQFRVHTVAAAAMPTSMIALSQFDAIVLINVPLSDLPAQTAALLPSYVRELGHGLAMIGGTRSFGAGGYLGSPIEEALPVAMDLKPRQQQQDVSVVVVIDVSGSMALEEQGSSKVKLAAAGAARLAAQLRDNDEITVIPYDNAPQGVIGPRPGSQRQQIIADVGRIDTAGSGITMYNALNEAAFYLNTSTKPVRHLITITDGDDSTQQQGSNALVQRMNQDGITVTSVALGDGHDVPFLKQLAQIGGGRFFLTERAAEIPNILLAETKLMMRPYLQEGRFAPQNQAGFSPSSGWSILKGVAELPELGGYVATTPKASSQVLLQTPQGDPLLAVWQYGLGRSMAWTSDLKGRWAGDLVRWHVFPTLAAQMIDWLLPQPGASRLGLAVQSNGSQVALQAHADDSGRPQTGLRLAGEIYAADGATKTVILPEQAPGTYALPAIDLPPGTYQIQLLATQANGDLFAAASSGVVIPRSQEYSDSPDRHDQLGELAAITGGRENPAAQAIYETATIRQPVPQELAPWLLWLTCGLLPLDVAIRRLIWWRRKDG